MQNNLTIKWSTDKFSKFLRDFRNQFQQTTPVVLKKFAAEVVVRVIARTPVASGRARYGWSGGMQELGYSVPPSTNSQAGDASYNESISPTDMSITISNNVPYILYLEYGWSKQAPLGMVRITMAEIRSWGGLPNILAKNYAAMWEGAGYGRYSMQRQIMGAGLPLVRDSLGTKPAKKDIPQLSPDRAKALQAGLSKTRARYLG